MGLLDKQAKAEPYMRREAEFGADDEAGIPQAYRYSLMRCWDETWVEGTEIAMYFALLNPSTADASIDDPTARRCIGFAKTCGMKALYIVNAYGLVATQPKHLWEHRDPVGPQNHDYIRAALTAVVNVGGVFVAGWGTHAREPEVQAIRDIADEVGASIWCLGMNDGGSPKHPLYLRADTALKRWH